MRIKLIRGKTVREAMSAVVEILGEHALILSVREIEGTGVEITAAQDDDPNLEEGVGNFDDALLSSPFSSAAGVLEWHGMPGQEGMDSEQDLASFFARNFRFEPVVPAGHSAPVLFCGPPGGGKSVYLARMAARMVMAGRKPLVVTTDSEKAGAVEQLVACTRVLGVDLIATDDTGSIEKLCRRSSVDSPVLIDTVGFSGIGVSDINWFSSVRKASGGLPVLILPAGGEAMDVYEELQRFRDLGVERLVLSKIDCVNRLGSLLQVARCDMALTEAGCSNSVVGGTITLDPYSLEILFHEKYDAWTQRERVREERKRELERRNATPDQAEPTRHSRLFTRRPEPATENKPLTGGDLLSRHIAMQAARRG